MDVPYPRAVLAFLGVALVAALLVVASTSGAAFGLYNAAWDGASDLQDVAADAGARTEVVRNTSAYRSARPNRTVAVVLSPDRPYRPGEYDRMRSFVRAGGTLVVAEDFGPYGGDLLGAVGASARFDGGVLRDERFYYRAPPLVKARDVSDHDLTAGVDALTLNYGTPVEPGAATVLAATSEFAYVDRNRDGDLDDAESVRSYPVATVEPVGDGRVVAVGDPSLLINAMLDRPGNRAFATNLLGSRSVVLLDYSHTASIPPLALAVLLLREGPLLQVLLGALGIGAIGLWVRGVPEAALARLREPDVPDRRPGLPPSDLRAVVRERHPDWDDERVERVIRGVLGERDDPETR